MGQRYIGSKVKILDKVVEKIIELTPPKGKVVDLMTGTASVAASLRKEGYKVTAIDVMTYSLHHARVKLLLNKAPTFKRCDKFIKRFTTDNLHKNNYKNVLTALNNVNPKKGYFWREFSKEGKPLHSETPRNYFSPENAAKIDGIRFWIKKLNNENLLTVNEHSLLLHDLIMATNDIANISGTYGHYLSKLMGRSNTPIKLKTTCFDINENIKGHKINRGYAEDLAKNIIADLCYIDPPYKKRQYAANYHILETIAREDNPPAIGLSGLRPWRDQYSNFCTKTKIWKSFETIFNDMKCERFLISYSEDGLIPFPKLIEFFKNFGDVKVDTLNHKRFKSNQSKLPPQIVEYLIQVYIKR